MAISPGRLARSESRPLANSARAASEHRLLEASRAGDVEAFAQLYDRFRRPLYGMCLGLLRDAALAEDVVQETFVRAYTKLDQFRGGRPLWPWLIGIAEHCCIDMLRRRRRVVLVDDVPEGTARATWAPAEADTTADAVLVSEERERLQRALAALPARQRRALLLFALEGWSYEDIARAEGISVLALKSLLFRARAALRESCQRGVPALVLLPFKALWDRARAHIGPVTTVSAQAAMATAASGQVTAALIALAMTFGSLGAVTAAEREAADPGMLATSADAYDLVAARKPNGPEAATVEAAPSNDALPVPSLVEDAADPNRDVTRPEHASIEEVTFSPGFEQDRTIFAVGVRTVGCLPRCPPVLFRSTDGGASWSRLAAVGFEGSSRLLLPPAFGRGDGRIYAMGSLGLQVSTDGGETFRPVGPSAQFVTGSAAISPRFNEGSPEILIGAQTLTSYNAALGSFAPAPYSSIPGPLEPAFSPDYAEDGVLLVGGMRYDPIGTGASATIFRCTSAVCEETVLGAGSRPIVRVAPDFLRSGGVVGFTSKGLFRSVDGGRSFARIDTPWRSWLRDVAFTSDGRLLFAAVGDIAPDARDNGLYVSRDGGGSWQRVSHQSLDGRIVQRVASRGDLIVVGLEKGLLCSADSGRSWQRRCG